MSVRRFTIAITIAIWTGVIVAGSLRAVAQTPATKPAAQQSQWLIVSIVKVVPGMNREYIELQTKEVMPAQRKGGSPGRQAWSSGVAGTPGEFVYITPITNFAQFDAQNPMVKALGEEGAAALGAKNAKLASTQKTMIVRTRPDLSYEPNPGAPPRLGLITIVDVVPGKRMEFEAFLKKDVVPAMQQAKVKGYGVLEVVYGDSIGTYITGVGYDSYEAIGKGHPFVLALGEDGARKLEARAAGIIAHVERFISRHRPELSWSAQSGSR